MRGLATVAPPDVVQLITEQMRRISESDQGGLLTLGILGALWSSSSALVGLISALNTAYDIQDSRAWWKVRLLAIGLTVALAIFLLISSTLVIAGPEIAGKLADDVRPRRDLHLDVEHPAVAVRADAGHHGAGAGLLLRPRRQSRTGCGFSPGAALATLLWLGISLGFRAYLQLRGGLQRDLRDDRRRDRPAAVALPVRLRDSGGRGVERGDRHASPARSRRVPARRAR